MKNLGMSKAILVIGLLLISTMQSKMLLIPTLLVLMMLYQTLINKPEYLKEIPKKLTLTLEDSSTNFGTRIQKNGIEAEV